MYFRDQFQDQNANKVADLCIDINASPQEGGIADIGHAGKTTRRAGELRILFYCGMRYKQLGSMKIHQVIDHKSRRLPNPAPA
jgi:hypothetical protein